MKKSIFVILAVLSLAFIAWGQGASDIVFHKPGYSIEKVVESNKVIDPTGLCFDDSGNLFVANIYGMIYSISPEGSIQKLSFGGYGYGSNSTYYEDIGINPITKEILIGSRYGIYKFDPTSGTAIKILPDPCYNLTFDSNGNLFFVYHSVGMKSLRKKIYNSSTHTYDNAFSVNLGFNPAGIAFDAAGNLIIGDVSLRKIYKLSPPFTQYNTPPNFPPVIPPVIIPGVDSMVANITLLDVTVDNYDNVYALMVDPANIIENLTYRRSLVRKYGPTYSLIYELGNLPPLNRGAAKNGELYISSTNYQCVKKVDVSGNISDFTEDNDIKIIYSAASDLEGNFFSYDVRNGKIFRISPEAQFVYVGTNFGFVRSVGSNKLGELFCIARGANNTTKDTLFKVSQIDGTLEWKGEFLTEAVYKMDFLSQDANRFVFYDYPKKELKLFDIVSRTKTLLANYINTTAQRSSDLDFEDNIYVGEGDNKAIKKAPFPANPPYDMRTFTNCLTFNIPDPYHIEYFDVSPEGDIYVPASTPQGEIFIGQANGGQAELLASGFSFPSSVHFDKYGKLWVVDAGNGIFMIIHQSSIVTQNAGNCSDLISEMQSPGAMVLSVLSASGDGDKNSMVKKLDNAKKSLEKGNIQAAIGELNAFRNSVAAQSGKKISVEEAKRWTIISSGMIDALERSIQ